ncbi:SENP7 protease [Entamoeba marina]
MLSNKKPNQYTRIPTTSRNIPKRSLKQPNFKIIKIDSYFIYNGYKFEQDDPHIRYVNTIQFDKHGISGYMNTNQEVIFQFRDISEFEYDLETFKEDSQIYLFKFLYKNVQTIYLICQNKLLSGRDIVEKYFPSLNTVSHRVSCKKTCFKQDDLDFLKELSEHIKLSKDKCQIDGLKRPSHFNSPPSKRCIQTTEIQGKNCVRTTNEHIKSSIQPDFWSKGHSFDHTMNLHPKPSSSINKISDILQQKLKTQKPIHSNTNKKPIHSNTNKKLSIQPPVQHTQPSNTQPLKKVSNVNKKEDKFHVQREGSKELIILKDDEEYQNVIEKEQYKYLYKGNPYYIDTSNRDTLLDNEMINDEIIDFYMKYIEEHEVIENDNISMFMSPFFINKINSIFTLIEKQSHNGWSKTKDDDLKKQYEQLCGWFNHKNIFDFKYVFIPYHQNQHFSLIVLCFSNINTLGNDVVLIDNPNTKKEFKEAPCILVIDSLHSNDLPRRLKVELYEFLMGLYYRLNKKDVVFNEKTMPIHIVDTIKQKNWVDCGCFMLYFIRKMASQQAGSIQDLLKLFNQKEANNERKRIADIMGKLDKVNK